MVWGPPHTIQLQISVCNVVCPVEVTFHTRSGNCNGENLQEFQITQVEMLDNVCPRQCTPDKYLAQVTFFMLLFNPMGFNYPAPPTVGENCATSVRASMSGCQFTWRSYKTGRTYVVQCANAPECCVARYRICVAPNGSVSRVQLVTAPIPPAACPTDPIQGAENPCRPSCNALTDLVDPYGKRSVSFDLDGANGATVAPNPATSSATITSPAMPDGGALLMLYDVRGRAVLNMRQETPAGDRYTFALDLRNVPAGAYYYVVKGNDAEFTSVGKLTVTK